MRRTQVYLEDNVWDALQARSREPGLSMSELVRAALREKYLAGSANRKRAMEAIVGLWKHRTDLPETESWVRSMRKDSHRGRLRSK